MHFIKRQCIIQLKFTKGVALNYREILITYIKYGILSDVMDILISLIVVIMSQWIGISKYHIVCLKYVHFLFVIYKPIKVENINNI